MTRARFFIALLMALAACSGRGTGGVGVEVVHVVDGDTLQVLIDGVPEDVRLVGVNTPELGECHADVARASVEVLLQTGDVRVTTAGTDDRDRFDRLLRYVYAGNTFVNLELVARGDGPALTGDHRRRDDFTRAADEAWERRLGMWARDACGPANAPDVAIVELVADPLGDDAERPNDETVVIGNLGTAPVDLSGWRLRDESSSHRFTFPAGSSLSPGAAVTVHSGCGTDRPNDLYWCAGPVWSNDGDTVILQAPNGNVIDRLAYR